MVESVRYLALHAVTSLDTDSHLHGTDTQLPDIVFIQLKAQSSKECQVNPQRNFVPEGYRVVSEVRTTLLSGRVHLRGPSKSAQLEPASSPHSSTHNLYARTTLIAPQWHPFAARELAHHAQGCRHATTQQTTNHRAYDAQPRLDRRTGGRAQL
ncbi:hypothetical protein BC834DRAFT_379954 [Gloeopeniophorella convolvens]|nr:hypothetical protein BC834DRAFT_379954 [Gloeopeniophorella convolvens]